MCGIMGYVGHRPAKEILIQGLTRLEYRGYDSSGVALLSDHQIHIKKAEGRIGNLEKMFLDSSSQFEAATCGMGHTRWATHGKPTAQNAHPHKTGHVVLVHNGIIENYLEIKTEIMSRGHRPQSETDSELFGFLVLDEMDQGLSLLEAVRKSFLKIRGQCSIVIMSEREPRVIVGVRNGSPLVVAEDPQGGAILASDAQPLLQFTRDVVFLEHGDIVVGTEKGLKFYDLLTGKSVQRTTTRLDWSLDKLEKGCFAHYMLKEIHEQPVALVDTLNALINRGEVDPFALVDQPGVQILDRAKEFIIVACGTSLHAAMLGKYWIERMSQVPVSVEYASEFRYRAPVVRAGAVIIGISQSGETADTLAVLTEMKKKGIPTLGISNVRGSSISREADAVFYTSAGPEIGVAATKTFSAQMLVMCILAGYLGFKRHTQNLDELRKRFDELIRLPHLLSVCLDQDAGHHSEMVKKIQSTIEALGPVKGFFFMGRGYSYPLALEGALKLKEIAYDHAEGYPAGELKHGPIAMIDEGMVVVVLAPMDGWRDKTVSNLEEVKARGAIIIGIGDLSDQALSSLCNYWIPLPIDHRTFDPELLPFVLTPAVQLLGYYQAVKKGTDIDKPRNLAKSVTVE